MNYELMIDDMVRSHRKSIQDKIDAARRKRRDPKPKYIFHGKGHDNAFYDKYYPHKKTKALFPPLSASKRNGIAIPGLKTLYRPIMGASPTDYYVRADGTQGNFALATGPCTSQGDCMTIATHDAAGDVYLPGETIYVCDNGGDFHDQFDLPSSGDANNQLVYEAVGSPVIHGSTAVTGWTEDPPASNKWKAALAVAPKSVWFVETDTTVTWGDEVANVAALAAEYDWVWVANELWCFAATDPDTRYNDVEASQRFAGFRVVGQDYITIDGIEIRYVARWGVQFDSGTTGNIVQNGTICYVSLKGDPAGQADGVFTRSNNSTISGMTIHNCGIHGIYIFTRDGLNLSGVTVESNELYDNYHSHIDPMNSGLVGETMSDVIIRYNHLHLTADYDIAYTCGGIKPEPSNNDGPITDMWIYYNLLHDFGNGITVSDPDIDYLYIYNNTVYKTFATYVGASSGISIKDAKNAANIFVKNNISVDADDICFTFLATQTALDVDYNLFYKAAGDVVSAFGVAGYTAAQFYDAGAGTYQFDYSPQDANSLCTDPLFADASSDDYHLQSGSPAVKAGTDVGLERDYDGVLVGRGKSNPDMGAFETQKGGPAGF